MKKLASLAFATLFASVLYGQAPEAFKYQAIARDASGNVLPNQAVGMRISIIQTSTAGPVVYQETHNVSTNAFGLMNMEVGTGSVVSGNFSTISWGSDLHFIQVEMDETGGTSYQVMGTSQLVSVPYAFHATTVENDNDQQTLTYNSGNGDLTISGGNTITLPLTTGGDNWGSQSVVTDATLTGDGTSGNALSVVGDLTDDQNLTLTGNTLSIDNGNSVDLSPYLDNTDAQTLSFAGTDLTISNGNTVDLSSLQDGVNDADADPTNEYNSTVILNGTDLEVTDGGGTIITDLSSLQDGVNDADADPTNEIQTLSLVGQDLTISGGNTVTLPGSSGNTLDQAYDQGGAGAGRMITADAGEVDITASTSNSIALRTTNSSTGVGIIAQTTNASNAFSAIQSTTNSNSTMASGVIGNTDGAAWGVSGQVSSGATATAAVYGSNLRTNGGHGVYAIGFNGLVGETNYSQGNAVWGENFDAIAPLGNGVGVAGTGFYGVIGEDRYLGAVPGAYGVFSNGELGASGFKSFAIDHPADPENKILRHFSIESNEVLNMYRGNVILDQNGEAVIEMPEYYDLINKNPSYNLTPIGGFAQLYVKEKIQDGKFSIAGGTPGMEVSWTVYTERNDPYMQQHPGRAAVEIDKREGQKGKYFMPELYGHGADKAIFPRSGKTETGQQPMNVRR